jgi:hypothetical protein
MKNVFQKINKLLILIISITGICSFSFAQMNRTRILLPDSTTAEITDPAYIYKDTLLHLFFIENNINIWKLRTKISHLNFDHCNRTVRILFYLDTAGQVTKQQLLQGTELTSVDSTILTYVSDLSGKLKPVEFEGKNIQSVLYLRFPFYNQVFEKALQERNSVGQINILVMLMDFSMARQRNPNKSLRYKNEMNECTDDIYFYEAGVKSYAEGDLKMAAYNFNQALHANARDYDALFNLGLTYIKQDKLKKACECFQAGSDVGYPDAKIAVQKYCKESEVIK